MVNFQQLFMQSKGKPIVYKDKQIRMLDKIDFSYNNIMVTFELLSTSSKWKQGIILQTKGFFLINEQRILNKIILWEDNIPNYFKFKINSSNKELIVYNVWQTEDGTIHYWHNGGAMYHIDDNNLRTYYCNDGQPNDDFNDIVFTLLIENDQV